MYIGLASSSRSARFMQQRRARGDRQRIGRRPGSGRRARSPNRPQRCRYAGDSIAEMPSIQRRETGRRAPRRLARPCRSRLGRDRPAIAERYAVFTV
ncbi:MAG: hypothetical protein VB124_02475 [Burkholderia sp.]